MNAMSPQTSPQVNMIRAIQVHALNRAAISAPGTSKKKYPKKNTPAPAPKISGVSHDRSFDIVMPA